MNVSPIPTTKIHKDHPKDQIIRDINSATQTRRMTKISEEHVMVSYIKKQRRTNHKDYQNCLFAYVLSQIEPKKVRQALIDLNRIEAMQDELLQFRLQKVRVGLIAIVTEYLVNISKRRAFWSLNEDILKISDSYNKYAVSIKEDTVYPCLHSPKTTKEMSSIRRIQRSSIRHIEDIVCEDFGRYQTWSLLQETPICHIQSLGYAKAATSVVRRQDGANFYQSQTSGQVEVSNQGLKRILERTVGENRASWSDKLDDALWAFRTAYKIPIGCTPYKLVYGKPCHLPIELEHRAYWALKHANFDLKPRAIAERTKKLHDSKIKNRIFNVGDQVLLFNSCLKIFSGKLKTRWSGPFTITEVFPYGTAKLSHSDGSNFKVNCHRLKHYFGGDTPTMVVPDLQTFPKDE
ncbi:reverse transcriptase domain-containing protein [Tanacetum coccineum]|uniref:Reverse transcriptase domain-containing protein n=1 Tax=Tanacetum coccineum TaxID=301880 RepID=A0ABQ5H372_9ASTR